MCETIEASDRTTLSTNSFMWLEAGSCCGWREVLRLKRKERVGCHAEEALFAILRIWILISEQ